MITLSRIMHFYDHHRFMILTLLFHLHLVGSLFLNTNITYTTCYEPVDLSQFIQKFLNLQSLPSRFDRSQTERINRAIKSLKIKPLHRPDSQAKYSICALWPKNASEVTFMNNETGQEESIATYFQRKYNMRLKYLHLVEMMGKRGDKIPIEVCGIVEVSLMS